MTDPKQIYHSLPIMGITLTKFSVINAILPNLAAILSSEYISKAFKKWKVKKNWGVT